MTTKEEIIDTERREKLAQERFSGGDIDVE